MSWQLWEVAETKILAGLSGITGPAKLNEMVQYTYSLHHRHLTFWLVYYSYWQNARPLSNFCLVRCISIFGRAWWRGHNFLMMTLSISQYNNYVIAIYDGWTLELHSQWPWPRHIKACHCLPNSPQQGQQHWSQLKLQLPYNLATKPQWDGCLSSW